ncbi:oligosaccharide flippase family protein [Endozoicomonas sp. SM1973]|uniref:Oligosaccharide flippase family protein n=1 Tax=Spartinivicinus marinus TaxID=2994442 RepID=A0A853ICH7_9GAMM|nr:oligosaccharide flippase family protein [Spartinivicinus marinus]MCX4028808.1 oligosaccharide flippase family protein [Spartinivicinus marinus]NYZ67621.1 oligosaccharide flippase family protein [Spartinivicinus marinus]
MLFSRSFRLLSINPIFLYSVAYGGAATFLKSFGFIISLWLAKSLSVEEYANYGLYYALQMGLATFATAGIIESVIGVLREYQSPVVRRRIFGAANYIFFLVSIVFIFLIFGVCWTLYQPKNNTYITIIVVLLAGYLSAFYTMQASLVRLEENHFASLCFSFFVPLVGLFGSLLFFLLLNTVFSFFLGAVFGLFLSLMILLFFRVGFYNITTHLKEIVPIFLRIIPFVGIAFLGWLSGYGNNYFISALFDASEVAKFTFVFTLSSIIQLVASSLNQVWSPRFFRMVFEQEGLAVEKKNRKFFRFQGILMGGTGGILIIIFPAVIDMLGGNLNAYQGMQVELLIMFTGYVITSPFWHCQNYFLVHDKGRDFMTVVFNTSLIGIIIWLFLMWALGSLGIYLGFLVQMLVRSLGAVVGAKKHWSILIAWEGLLIGILVLGIGLLISTKYL